MGNFEGKIRQLAGVFLIALFSFLIGYVFASGYAQYRFGLGDADFLFILQNYAGIKAADPRAYVIINVIMVVFVFAGLVLGGKVVSEDLTRLGRTRWQTKRDMKRRKFFSNPGLGFVLGKPGKPGSKKPFIVSAEHPHCLLVAPTGRGKGVGFVIPNLLTYKGSAVVLDVKGENFEKTARHRKSQGDIVYRFAPTDWSQSSHSYNPLARVARMENPAQRMLELQKIATLFLQPKGQGAEEFLPGAIDIFIACGMYAYEKSKVTLGEVYRYAVQGGEPKVQYAFYAREAKDPATKIMFNKLANTTERTLSAYVSVLNSTGLGAWSNPRICALTDESDFEFVSFRKTPQTVYLVVPPDDIPSIAPLIRLFFSDLIASIQGAGEPGADEPYPILIMLDEFDRLGKMPIVAESIKTLRSYGGNLAIVTQTIPALDEIYGQNVRLSLQGGAGIKLYLTPSEEKTVSDLSQAVGVTTRRVVSKSRTIGRGPFNGVNVSERTEEKPLLPDDEARRLPKDDVIIVVDADMPIRAKRIKYYEDRYLRPLFESQAGEPPYPEYNSAADNYQFPTDGLIEDCEAKAADLSAGNALKGKLQSKAKDKLADVGRVAELQSKMKRRRRSVTYRKAAQEVDFSRATDSPENRERLRRSQAAAKSLLSDLVKTADFSSSDIPSKAAPGD